MKTLTILLLLAASVLAGSAATTINSVNKFSYGANIGWMDWRGEFLSWNLAEVLPCCPSFTQKKP